LAANTAIRPMDVSYKLGNISIFSIIAGSLCSLVGTAVCFWRRHWWCAGFGFFSLVLSWTPMLIGMWGFNHIIALKMLVLEP
jgi:hypothetical protein